MSIKKSVSTLAISLAMISGSAMISAAMADEATGDAAKGAKVFARCKSCHTTAEGPSKLMGPSLHGLIGRQSGSVEYYQKKYSPAMKGANLVWNEENLDKYLTNPRNFIPKNRMAFAGIPNAQQRKDLIAYLEEATQ